MIFFTRLIAETGQELSIVRRRVKSKKTLKFPEDSSFTTFKALLDLMKDDFTELAEEVEDFGQDDLMTDLVAARAFHD